MRLLTAHALHSRSVLAGYDPDRLSSARVLLAGAGALGQNTLLDLALSGVGDLVIIDPDTFEEHNRTRSPLYPDATQRGALGLGKAVNAAAAIATLATAAAPRIRYSQTNVEALGPGLIAWADVVVAAVDTLEGRSWLAEHCRLLATPMVEGGFRGPRMNLSVFGAVDGPCFRCVNPVGVGSFSCTRYARDADADEIVPAIQTAAAVLGGYQAEHTLQVLHGGSALEGRRLRVDIRSGETTVTDLTAAPRCPTRRHEPLPLLTEEVEPHATLSAIGRALSEDWNLVELVPPEPTVVAMPCTGCGVATEPGVARSTWRRSPRCRDCDGPYEPLPERRPEPLEISVWRPDDLEVFGADLSAAKVGLGPGSIAQVRTEGTAQHLIRIAGDVEVHLQDAPDIPHPGGAPPAPFEEAGSTGEHHEEIPS